MAVPASRLRTCRTAGLVQRRPPGMGGGPPQFDRLVARTGRAGGAQSRMSDDRLVGVPVSGSFAPGVGGSSGGASGSRLFRRKTCALKVLSLAAALCTSLSLRIGRKRERSLHDSRRSQAVGGGLG